MSKNLIRYSVGSLTLLLALTAVFGWFTSTRNVEMILKIDGAPCSSCVLRVIGVTSGEERFVLDEGGKVVLPSSFVGRAGICAIERDGERLLTFAEHGFRRGVTTVDFGRKGNRSTHVYRFLFFENRSDFEIEQTD